MIERRRRERINECLNQLQTLISQLDKDKQKVDVRVSNPHPLSPVHSPWSPVPLGLLAYKYTMSL